MKLTGLILDDPEPRPSLIRDAIAGTLVILAFAVVLLVVGGHALLRDPSSPPGYAGFEVNMSIELLNIDCMESCYNASWHTQKRQSERSGLATRASY